MTRYTLRDVLFEYLDRLGLEIDDSLVDVDAVTEEFLEELEVKNVLEDEE